MAQDFATEWLWTYNNDRPNMGIGGITPAQKLKTAAEFHESTPLEMGDYRRTGTNPTHNSSLNHRVTCRNPTAGKSPRCDLEQGLCMHPSRAISLEPPFSALPEIFFPRRTGRGVHMLFEGRQVGYSFNTRVAIRRACDLLGIGPGTEVLAPAYNCGSEIDPLRQAGASVRLYPVDRRAQIDPDAVERMIGSTTRAIYLTHYFGFLQPEMAALRSICDRHGLALIEDRALSLLSGSPPAGGLVGDVAVFCFYKFLPVIKGGALVVNNPLLTGPGEFHRPPPTSMIAKQLVRRTLGGLPGTRYARAAARWVKRRSGTASASGHDAPHPDIPSNYYFDPDLRDTAIARMTMKTLATIDVDAVIRRRRQNYLALRDLLRGVKGLTLVGEDLPPGTCPLGLPILVEDRASVLAALDQRGISTSPWWSGYHRDMSWDGCVDACYLKDRVIVLPVHQALEVDDMSYIAKHLAEILNAS